MNMESPFLKKLLSPVVSTRQELNFLLKKDLAQELSRLSSTALNRQTKGLFLLVFCKAQRPNGSFLEPMEKVLCTDLFLIKHGQYLWH